MLLSSWEVIIVQKMISVITGDIINSRKADPARWLDVLKTVLSRFGNEPKDWEIYRGDSFQLRIEDYSKVLIAAFEIKAAVKKFSKLDIRMSIGIGEQSYHRVNITESSGSVYFYSGELLEKLKKEKCSLAIKSDWPHFDREINLYLKLGLIAMDSWTPVSAESVSVALEKPNISQHEIGHILGVKQNTVSYRLKRAYFEEILEINEMFKYKLSQLL